MFFSVAKAMAFAKSDGPDAFTAYVMLSPGSQGSSREVNGSQLSLATAAAMIDEGDSSLPGGRGQLLRGSTLAGVKQQPGNIASTLTL